MRFFFSIVFFMLMGCANTKGSHEGLKGYSDGLSDAYSYLKGNTDFLVSRSLSSAPLDKLGGFSPGATDELYGEYAQKMLSDFESDYKNGLPITRNLYIKRNCRQYKRSLSYHLSYRRLICEAAELVVPYKGNIEYIPFIGMESQTAHGLVQYIENLPAEMEFEYLYVPPEPDLETSIDEAVNTALARRITSSQLPKGVFDKPTALEGSCSIDNNKKRCSYFIFFRPSIVPIYSNRYTYAAIKEVCNDDYCRFHLHKVFEGVDYLLPP